MPTHPRQPLRIETQYDDRVVVLGCDSCTVTIELRTTDADFATAVQRFFEAHAGCSAAHIDLS